MPERRRAVAVRHPVRRLRAVDLEARGPSRTDRSARCPGPPRAGQETRRSRRPAASRTTRRPAAGTPARTRTGPRGFRAAPRTAGQRASCPTCPADRGAIRPGPTRTAGPHAPSPVPRAGHTPGSNRSGAGRVWRAAGPASNPSPDACASRWRTVAPGGPAGSSRSIDPRSAAARTTSAVSGFVTEAQANPRPGSPRRARTPSGAHDGRRGRLDWPAIDRPKHVIELAHTRERTRDVCRIVAGPTCA